MIEKPGFPEHHDVLTWTDVDRLIDQIVPQVRAIGGFGCLLLITRGGVIPGGMLAEALDMRDVLTAAVDFPAKSAGLMAWSQFIQFPQRSLLDGRRVLIVDDVWGTGRTSVAVRQRVIAEGGEPFNCVLHYNPYRSLFKKEAPDFYGSVTSAYIVYPWEVDRGTRGMKLTL